MKWGGYSWFLTWLWGLVLAMFVTTLTLSWANGNPSQIEPVQLSLQSQPPIKQGSIIIAQLKTATTLPDKVRAKFNGQTIPFFEVSPHLYQALLGVSVDTVPGEKHLSVIDASGNEIAEQSLSIQDAHFLHQNIVIGKGKAGLQPLPGELETIEALKEMMTPVRYWTTSLMSPTPGCENSPFGVKRYHNGVYIHDYHKGVDLRAPYGQPIHAVTAGMVVIAAPHFRLHGGTVGLDHGQGLTSIYIHMSKVAVKQGQFVKKGDIIGYIGATGFATGPHLHWGLYASGVPVNPDQWVHVPHC